MILAIAIAIAGAVAVAGWICFFLAFAREQGDDAWQ